MSFASDMAEIPQFKRGLVWCTECGREESFKDGAANVQGGGWPECCGYTMTLDSPEERKAFDLARNQTEVKE